VPETASKVLRAVRGHEETEHEPEGENREARAAVILKPPRTSRDGRLKILDFGLAEPKHQEEGGQGVG
jgi:hypothetical protein